MSAGNANTFSCDLFNELTGLEETSNIRFTWNKQSGQLPDAYDPKPNGDIVLYNLQERDSGVYVCKIEDLNTGKLYEAVTSLIVLPVEQEAIVPLTVEVVRSATLIQGRDTEFVCTVQGGKSPVVTWKKISDNLDPNRHIQNGNNLQIKNIQPEDRGYFPCNR